MLPSTMSKPEISAGTLIDSRYMIQQVLGQGGLGRTYLAFDTRRFNEPCVLKEFAPSGSGKHSLKKSRALFKREAEILYHIQHPQIPNFLACFEGDGRLFLVQEFVNGQTYSELLKERSHRGEVFTEQEVIEWLNNLLPVLDYIHQRGIIHRDISPDNIMLPTHGELPVLIDFGVGKQIVEAAQLSGGPEEDGTEEMSYVGKLSLVGKVGYAPHEQIRLGICSASSDLYALGVTAVVLLTCKDPSMLMNQYSLQWQWRHYAEVSDEFGEILDRLLADTPAARYQSATDVMTDLAFISQVEATFLSMPEATTIEMPNRFPRQPQTLVTDTEFPNVRISHPPMASRLSGPPAAPHASVTPAGPSPNLLNPSFVEKCKLKLADYIGPMAALIVDEVLNQQPQLLPGQLVELLITEIPDSREASEFRQAVLS
jgi:serine/threonine protein kinase